VAPTGSAQQAIRQRHAGAATKPLQRVASTPMAALPAPTGALCPPITSSQQEVPIAMSRMCLSHAHALIQHTQLEKRVAAGLR
jgi:hypothetical protein